MGGGGQRSHQQHGRRRCDGDTAEGLLLRAPASLLSPVSQKPEGLRAALDPTRCSELAEAEAEIAGRTLLLLVLLLPGTLLAEGPCETLPRPRLATLPIAGEDLSWLLLLPLLLRTGAESTCCADGALERAVLEVGLLLLSNAAVAALASGCTELGREAPVVLLKSGMLSSALGSASSCSSSSSSNADVSPPANSSSSLAVPRWCE